MSKWATLALVAAVLLLIQWKGAHPAFAERLMNVWSHKKPLGGRELIADPDFKAGFLAIRACRNPDGDFLCAKASRYQLKSPDRPDMADVKPVWELAQWGSRSNLGGGGRFDGGYGWSTPDKRLVVYPDGRVELAVSGDSELGGKYNSNRAALPNLILQQTIAAPGTYGRHIPSLDRMQRLTFNLDFRRVYDDPNKKPGYDTSRHAIIFPVNFTIQNLNRRSPGYGEYVWLQISTYDDRYALQTSERDRTQIDLGTKRLIYFIPPSKLSNRSTHLGEWVQFHGDILPYARRAIEIASKKGFLRSVRLSDYKVGGVNIGYELTGLNISTFQFRRLSLKASTDD
ncbi:hypothetical protein ASD03_30955 [Ensifer sp. Root127]|nr:hypothetical protein ASD03_30955 [Ensifer sp. Root127]